MNKILIISLIFAVCCLLLTQPVSAQSLSLSLSPPIMEIMIQPGRQITLSYQITNNSENALTLSSSVKKLLPVNANGQIAMQEVDRDSPIKLSFEGMDRLNQPFLLNVGETKHLVLQMAVNHTALEKDYYYTLLFSTDSTGQSGLNQTSSISKIGSNLLITVSQSGNPVLAGEASFENAPRIVDSFSRPTLNLLITNTGNTLFKPFGTLTLTGWLNQQQTIALLEHNVLAGSTRRFAITLPRLDLPLGKVNIKVVFQPNQTPPVIASSTTIYYVPYKLVGGVLLVVIVLQLFRRFRRNSRIKTIAN